MAIETTPKFKKNFEKVKLGNVVEFQRKGHLYKGEVTIIRDMTVVIKVESLANPKEVAFENNVTVVNHGNYKILHKAQLLSS